MTAGGQPYLLRLGQSSWWLWRDSAVRSAGFPAAGIDRLVDRRLADLATADPRELAPAWPAALDRARAAARTFAADPRFREAVAWQNPAMIRNCLDVTRLRRKHELAIASYAQRYLVKNDTIGFFGPVAWAQWTGGSEPLRVRPGPELLARRAVYFETWAVDALAHRLAREPELQPWLRPRLVASCVRDGRWLRRPTGPPLALTVAQAALLSRCDGRRPVRELAEDLARPAAAVLAQLRQWQADGVVELGLDGPVEARPEVTLRRRLAGIGAPGPRERALGALAALEAARDRVAEAAGDPAGTVAALAALDRVFEAVTGTAPTRRPGEAYAGRTPVYLDSLRDATVELGRPLAELLAPPLALLLDSARWLVARVAEGYQELLDGLLARCAERVAPEPVPLAMLLSAATPHFLAGRPAPVAAAVGEFQHRWARILRLPPGVRRYAVPVEAVAPGVRAEFPVRPVPWAAAVHHSPDLLIGVEPGRPGPDGGLTAVLGELHLARNTLENRPLVEFHDQPGRLLAAAEADHGSRRAYHVPPKEWPQVNSRTYPSPLLSPRFRYWCRHSGSSGAAGPVLPAADLTVHRRPGRLVVVSRSTGAELDLLELLGEQLSHVVVNAFRMLPETGHRPRVRIGSLVVHRESWSLDTRQVAWAQARDRADRFRLAQQWRRSLQLPVRGFCRTPGEKPVFVDFRSVSLVELLARTIRRAAAGTHPERFTLTEMLPGTDQTWLVDAQGAGYTAEVRCVAVDRSG